MNRYNISSIIVATAFLLLGGCKSLDPAGVYAGDQLLYKAEVVIPTSYELIHTFVTWERNNRELLTNNPGIKEAADKMRAQSPKWFATAHALRDAYKGDPTPENADALQKILNILRVALAEAQAYMIEATN